MNAMFVRAAAALLSLSFCATAMADLYDPRDDQLDGATKLRPGHPPITRDFTFTSPGAIVDRDWYKVMTSPYSSYEVILGWAEPSALGMTMTRYDATGTTVVGGGRDWFSTDGMSAFNQVQHMRWKTTTLTPPDEVSAIVAQGNDSPVSLPYTFEFRETTLYCPRFNNTGSQRSILIIQSSMQGDFYCDYSAHFFGANGAHVAKHDGEFLMEGALSPMLVLDTSSVAGLAGIAGNARIAHTCGLTGITAKLVSLDPTTGFSFDTTCASRQQ